MVSYLKITPIKIVQDNFYTSNVTKNILRYVIIFKFTYIPNIWVYIK